MKTKHIIIGLIILVVVLFLMQKKEHAGSTATQLSNEAIQNIGKVYGDTRNTASFNSINATGSITTKNLKAEDGSGNFGTITVKDLIVTGDIIVKGTGNSSDNIVRIGVNRNGDGAASTISNIGIFAENKTTGAMGKLQVNNFELGRKQVVSDANTPGVVGEKKYDYVRSNLKSSAFVNKDQTGLFNMMWTDGNLYWTWLANNIRNSRDFGAMASPDYDS